MPSLGLGKAVPHRAYKKCMPVCAEDNVRASDYRTRWILVLPVLSVLLFLLNGCGGGGGTSTVINPPPTGNGTGTGVGQLSANPTSIAFGNVTIGNTSQKSVQISNVGGEGLTVSSASTNGPGFSVNGLSLPITLSANQNVSFNVNFTPTSAGAASGSVQLSVSGISTKTTISLSGTGTTSVAHSVTVDWNPSTSTVVGYNVYRADQSGGTYKKVNSSLVAPTIYTDATVSGGHTYWYVVTSVASGNLESGYSSAIAAVVPSP